MAKSKYVYAVMVRIKNNTYRYVTELGEGKTAYWEEGKKAMTFNKSFAEALTMGLRCNFYVALTIKVEDYMENCLINDYDTDERRSKAEKEKQDKVEE